MQERRPTLLALTIAIGALALQTAATADFGADGYADLVIGAPEEDHVAANAGAFSAIYGGPTGLRDDNDQYFTESPWLLGEGSEPNDYLGTSFAIGDFNGDGAADLAIGSPLETVGSVIFAGAVHIVPGSKLFGVLNFLENTYWTQDEPGVEGTAETNDHFGTALASGDFNGDGYDDLAVGVPDEDINATVTTEAGGLVHVFFGSPTGLSTTTDHQWTQEDAGSSIAANNRFGAAVASGDFDGDGYDDLAIGAPGDDLVDIEGAGAVDILYGGPAGLHTRVLNDHWHQDRSGIPSTAEANDGFGYRLAVGDFDHDGLDDLVVGVPFEDLDGSTIMDTGCLHVLFGSDDGISAAGSQYLTQNSPGIGSNAEENDEFGWSFAVGDFDGDSYDDLAVGSPYEDWNEVDSGIVQVLFGSSSGLATPDVLWRQDLLVDFGTDEEGDQFGYALAAGDFDGDGFDELAIGSPGEDISSAADAGVVFVLPGSDSGLLATNQYFYQGKLELGGEYESGDRFGAALASVPGASGLFQDGFESGDVNRWSSTSP